MLSHMDGKYYSCNRDEDRGEQRPGAHVVRPQWHWGCVSQWQRMPEAPYEAMLHAMDPVGAQRPGPSPSGASFPLLSADPVDGSSYNGPSSPPRPGPTVGAVAESGSNFAPGCSSLTSSSEVEGNEFLGSGGKGLIGIEPALIGQPLT
ncbi:hypothetical protein BS47DRAFT_135675 [Hydnum rufescens UP504]|uniref:Uncharacterized protein n=1 Tax=Hydnum rufescens UP504 TaxID=1448309 RepID=A0A9P6DP67_9AGAM|nr:hypothetical protein BS47DRAFT_135675 [Hydnum rufescens UP504]